MSTALLWFRRDLRLTDNPALLHALRHCDHLLPVYIHRADEYAGAAASSAWLHHSLGALKASLQALGSDLIIRSGNDSSELLALCKETKADQVFWNRLYEPERISSDTQTRDALKEAGLETRSFNGALMFEPWEIEQKNGNHYRVFTPYWKSCVARGYPEPPGAAPDSMPPLPAGLTSSSVEELNLLPKFPWDKNLIQHWVPGESGALASAANFGDEGAADYIEGRNLPATPGTSKLSPHLHFGEISPLRIASLLQQRAASGEINQYAANAQAAIRQLSWRDFAHHLLFHHPRTVQEPLSEQFVKFQWASDYQAELKAWQKGKTGVPLVDAGMRELWHTGWMHNRVRMVVASFLCKNLLIPWQEGASWFIDTLVDADLANNTMGWQWVAGCGADAAPYFRVFNPVLQGQKFDPDGEYVKRWLPELKDVSTRHVHKPWEAPAAEKSRAYPPPIVDLKATRDRALAAYASMRADS